MGVETAELLKVLHNLADRVGVHAEEDRALLHDSIARLDPGYQDPVAPPAAAEAPPSPATGHVLSDQEYATFVAAQEQKQAQARADAVAAAAAGAAAGPQEVAAGQDPQS